MGRILILGGDGFCGWPTALHLSSAGHEVTLVDNFARRRADVELGVSSLTPIASLDVRLTAWKELTGLAIEHVDLDVARDYEQLLDLLQQVRPQAVVHLAEQRSAPYSMKSPRHKRSTVENNVAATHNLLCAIVDSGQDIHVVHIGTMGVYGYGGGYTIPEGYLKVEAIDGQRNARVEREILHPVDPGSIYHMTKTVDQMLFLYYNKNDRLRITDLHQGIVWGTNTRETSRDPRLINRFDYDGDYGTVLNRFLMQAAIGYPLTVHGSGGQTRAFIHIRDTVRCIELAIDNPPPVGERVRIFNQMTAVHRVIELARYVARLTGAPIQFVPNPRAEAERNDLDAEARQLPQLGLKPTLLEDALLEEVIEVAQRYADRCDRSRIPCTSTWRRDIVLEPVHRDSAS
jgi:UDP-sulfoquinovose synthase